MRVILLYVQLIIACAVQAQDKLYYFKSDSTGLVGVKDDKDKIIVPPIFEEHAKRYNYNKEIPEPTIEFTLLPKGQKSDFSNVVVPWGNVYSRDGKFLYHPLFYDNGTDYWWEGTRRYVENGKVGFVDKYGRKLTAATWDYAGWFNYGYAPVYEGNLKKIYDAGGEHWSLGSDGQMISYLINKSGQRVQGYSLKKRSNDYLYDGLYYPYPFVYNEDEQVILNRLNKDIIGIAIMANANRYNYKYTPLHLEITERPSAYQPHYVIQMYQGDEKYLIDSEKIFVNAETKIAYVDHHQKGNIQLQQAMILSLEKFIKSVDKQILAETRKIAENELKRLKSQP